MTLHFWEFTLFINFRINNVHPGKEDIVSIKKFLIWLLICVPVAVNGCQTVKQALSLKKPRASLQSVGFGNVNTDSAELVFDVEIQNPYSSPLPLTNMEYGMKTSDRKLFSGAAEIARTIPANESRTVSLPVNIRYADLIGALKEFRPGSQIPYKADLSLSLDAPVVGKFALPLSKTGKLAIPDIQALTSPALRDKLLDALGN